MLSEDIKQALLEAELQEDDIRELHDTGEVLLIKDYILLATSVLLKYRVAYNVRPCIHLDGLFRLIIAN